METLCRAGADKNARNRRRQSPLHVAVSTAVAQTLLEFGAMASLHDADGYAHSALVRPSPSPSNWTTSALTIQYSCINAITGKFVFDSVEMRMLLLYSYILLDVMYGEGFLHLSLSLSLSPYIFVLKYVLLLSICNLRSTLLCCK